MRIIIVGCGKLGHTLVEQLSQEEHDLVVIDEDARQLQSIKDELDVMSVVGNGVSHSTLVEAGVNQAHLLIAVTGSDEQNLLCCLMAKKSGRCKTIARVRNPIYLNDTAFIKKELGLAMVINPEYETAREIAHLFQFPSAMKIDRFANGNVELLHFRVAKDSVLNGKKIIDIRSNISPEIIVCSVMRDDVVYIPNGDFVVKENDKLAVVGKRRDSIEFFKKLGLLKGSIRNAIIAGGGKISYYLASALIHSGIDVTIIEMDRMRCEQLAELLPKATIICGDATDQNVLEEEGLQDAQGFVALTGLDEENIFVSLYARGVSDAKIITKINRINFMSVINQLDLDCIVSPRVIMSDYITRYVRSFNNSEDSNVERLYKLDDDGRVEALEFFIKEKSDITDTPLKHLKIRKNTLICSIYRNGQIIIPTGDDTIQVHDSVIVVLADYRISDIKEILED